MEFVQRYAVRLVKDGRVKTDKTVLTQPIDVYHLMAPIMEDLCVEQFYVLMLDVKNKIIGISMVSQGTISSALVHPRDVFQRAILANSAGIILVHNHPSGDPKASPEDVHVTKQLIDAGKLLGISVLDHIIIGETTYESLKNTGVI